MKKKGQKGEGGGSRAGLIACACVFVAAGVRERAEGAGDEARLENEEDDEESLENFCAMRKHLAQNL